MPLSINKMILSFDKMIGMNPHAYPLLQLVNRELLVVAEQGHSILFSFSTPNKYLFTVNVHIGNTQIGELASPDARTV